MSISKVIYGFSALALLSSFVFFNLGKWIDVTEEPVKSDIIVCLGGGTIERVKKSIALLEESYVENNIFLLIGESWYNQPYLKKNYPNLAVIIDESPKNTKEEVLFIKQYMKAQGYKNALIVTDPPHSGRVQLLTFLLTVEGDESMTFRVVGSDVGWWDKDHYWKNKRARDFVKHEIVGILYHFIFD